MVDTKPEGDFSHVLEPLNATSRPIFHVSRGAAHLTGVERFVPGLRFIRMRPQGEDRATSTFIPSSTPRAPMGAIESVNWLLRNRSVQEYISEQTPPGVTPAVIFSNFDDTTEKLSASLGYEVLYPPAATRKRLDSKVLATELCGQIGLDNVPNILTDASSWDELTNLTTAAGLGTSLVLQTAYGEGGEGTYFVHDRDGFTRIREQLRGQRYKAMRRINHISLAVEAVVTASGVLVGPVLREIVGHKELAIHAGSSSGLEYRPGLVTSQQQNWITEKMSRFGELLRGEGYRGLFEVDFLYDLDSGELFFGETNPRFSGCAMVSNAVTATAWGVPLYAFHLLEFMGFADGLPVENLNRVWSETPPQGQWANVVLRYVGAEAAVMRNTPVSGTYRLESEPVSRASTSTDWFPQTSGDTGVLLQYKQSGDILVPGDETGLLLVSQVLQDDDAQLTGEARHLIAQTHTLLRVKPLGFFTRAVSSLTRRLSRRFGSSRPPRQG